MNTINFKREISGTVDNAVQRVTMALASVGFGILTRIDMHSKISAKTLSQRLSLVLATQTSLTRLTVPTAT